VGEHRDVKFGVQLVPVYGGQFVPEMGVVTSSDPFLPRDAMLAQ